MLTRTGAFEIDITIENDHLFVYTSWLTMYVLHRCIYCIHAIYQIVFMSDDVININIKDITHILAT